MYQVVQPDINCFLS